MSATPLLVYLNSDVAMERPYRVSLPASVDTLAELCQFLTARIPPKSGEDTTGRGYRFLYSVVGKPLWRVKECLDAGTVVLSIGPGFLTRRPAAISDGGAAPSVSTATPSPAVAAEAAPSPSIGVVDLLTPDRPAGPSDRQRPREASSSSASPPVKIPTEGRYGAAAATAAASAHPYANGVGLTASTTAAYAPTNERASVNAAGAYARRSTDAAAASAAVLGTDPSVRRASLTDEKERLVSININPAARGGFGVLGSGSTTGGEGDVRGKVPAGQAAPPNAWLNMPDVATPSVRLFTPPGTSNTATTSKSGLGSYSSVPPRAPQSAQRQPSQPQPAFTQPPPLQAAATMGSTTASDLPRGVVFLAHETYSLPRRPTFVSPTDAAARAAATPPPLQPLAGTSVSSSLHFLLLRKWAAYQKLHNTAPADLIAGEALSQQFNIIVNALKATRVDTAAAVFASQSTSSPCVCRVLVSGPTRSGVSTTAAFFLRHLIRTLQFQPPHRLYNTLILALDFHLLFGTAAWDSAGASTQEGAPGASAPPPRVLLDLTSLFQLVIRSVMDAVVAQRPGLREAGPLLSQLWDLVVKPHTEPHVAPNFTTYTQAVAIVGVGVLTRWSRLAELIFPILQAACRTPEVVELRDAALDLIFYAIPAEVAASLEFSGLFYAVDGAETLTRCYRNRVTRPAGDLGPLLHAITSDTRTHLLVAWPSTLPPQTWYVPCITAHVSTVGLITRDTLVQMQLPLLIKSNAQEFPVELFLGCPGYLRCLAALVRPFRKNLTVPTTAYSSYYQQNYDGRGSRGVAEQYSVRIDTYEVTQALTQLLQLVHALPMQVRG